MSFRIRGLDPHPFVRLYGLSDAALSQRGVIRMQVEEPFSAPDRIELRDAQVGEHVLLLNHVYLNVDTPYRGQHAIFVREGATAAYDGIDTVPDALRRRLLSLRAFTASGMMIDADVTEGAQMEPLLLRLLSLPSAAFVQIHHARRGCFAASAERA